MLIGDRDRDTVIARLREAAGDGRLTVNELEQRVERAMAARVAEDLAPLVADLPVPREPRRRTRRAGKHALFGPVLAALIVASVLLNGIPVWLLAMPLAYGGGACRSPRRFI